MIGCIEYDKNDIINQHISHSKYGVFILTTNKILFVMARNSTIRGVKLEASFKQTDKEY